MTTKSKLKQKRIAVQLELKLPLAASAVKSKKSGDDNETTIKTLKNVRFNG